MTMQELLKSKYKSPTCKITTMTYEKKENNLRSRLKKLLLPKIKSCIKLLHIDMKTVKIPKKQAKTTLETRDPK